MSPKLEKPLSSQDGGLALLGLGVRPTVTSPLERSGRWSPYHRNGNACSSFAWSCFVDCFIHKNGNDSSGVTARWRARDSTEDAEPMWALSRRQSWLGEEGKPREAGGLAEPSSLVLAEPFGLVREESREAGGLAEPLARYLATSEMPPRGEAPRRGKKPWRGSPGLESLVLSENF